MNKATAAKVARLLNTIPKSIRVGPFNYEVRLADELITIEGDPVKKLGVCHPNQEYVELAVPGLHSAEGLVALFLHELVHAIWNYHNLGNKAKEEDAVLAMETGLTLLFKDNPDLLDWLKKGLK